MAISRSLMERQLRAGGGIMTLEEPRQGYFLGKIVKKAKRAVKKVVKSPLGKAALAGAALYGLGGGTMFGKSLPFLKSGGGFSLANLGANLGFGSIGSGGKFAFDGPLAGLISTKGKFSPGKAGLLGLGAASFLPMFMGGGDDEEVVEDTSFTDTPDSIASIVNMAKQQDPSLRFLPKPKFVDNFYAADGGLASLDTPKRGMVDGPGSYAGRTISDFLMNEGDMKNRRPPSKFDFMKETGPISESDKKFLENLSEEDLEELKKMKGPFFFEFLEEILKTPYLIRGGDVLNDPKTYPGNKDGGRIGRAEGGLMDLGGFEKDYREGGFVPLGAEERADDVPARLSKNEFVFTADAVRNAGGGDIDKGAEVMQNMMDNLEAGGTISEESQGMNPAQEMFDQSQMLEGRLA